MDDPVQPGDRLPPGVQLRRVRRRRHDGHRRRRAGGARVAGSEAAVRAGPRAVRGATARRARASSTRSTSASRSASWPTYVTLEQGTGAVHTAPGHGADDFNTGVQYGLDIYAPVGPGGHFLDEVEIFAGPARLRREPADRGGAGCARPAVAPGGVRALVPALLALPQPGDLPRDVAVVHRDGRGRHLRERALEAVRKVQWIPAWGEERIQKMLENRPDWCISRQRSWGVPIPAVDCATCGEAILTTGARGADGAVFAEHGADAWYERPIEEFLPAGARVPARAAGGEFVRERDILDVWFDSGSSHEAVLGRARACAWPADLYLEGSDQYRGWFQSSLLVGIGTRGESPVPRGRRRTASSWTSRAGRCRSRSATRSSRRRSSPRAAPRCSGCGRRWWTTARRSASARRSSRAWSRPTCKLRNTLRILVANLYDFEPADRRRAGGGTGGAGSLRPRALRRASRRGSSRPTRRTTSPPSPQARERVRHGRSQRLLRGRVEGPPLHAGAEVRGAALRADGDVRHGGRPRAADRADPAGDGRRAVAASCRDARGIGPPRPLPRRARDSWWTPALVERWGRLLKLRDGGQRRTREAAAGQGRRQVARGAASSCGRAARCGVG